MSATTFQPEMRAERLACGDGAHLPGCHNPQLDRTWCICGRTTWAGNVGTWHSVPQFDHAGKGAQVVGWECYFMCALDCGEGCRGCRCACHDERSHR